jgi:hypothetical protein
MTPQSIATLKSVRWRRNDINGICVTLLSRSRGTWFLLKRVREFKYLGRIVSENDDDTPAMTRRQSKKI